MDLNKVLQRVVFGNKMRTTVTAELKGIGEGEI